LSCLRRWDGVTYMEPIIGHWLDVATEAGERTPDLGIRLEGLSEVRPNSKAMSCPNCSSGQLSLFATCETSAFIHLSKFALMALQVCVDCAAETDGSVGANGFFPVLRHIEDGLPMPVLPKPIYFRATPTGEPSSEAEFRKWQTHVKAKIGGRQLSIQPPLQANCEKCSAPLVFVSSIDELWAPPVLNFAGGFGYLFVCKAECSSDSALFYWDCD
jgi:hypothetical protein